MFALAIWDSRIGRLVLGRDRFGQKPLYYYEDSKVFVFASEIKAILAHPAVPRVSRFDADNRRALAEYLSFGYVQAPYTAFRDIWMLQPALVKQVDVATEDGEPYFRDAYDYWDPSRLAPPDPAAKAETYIGELREKLAEAVKLRLVSDVPLGAFLSGGLDSSLIVALMRRNTATRPSKPSASALKATTASTKRYTPSRVARHLGNGAYIVPRQARGAQPAPRVGLASRSALRR